MKLLNILAILILSNISILANADIPRAEYPRPQMQRNEWINLNGPWTCSFDFSASGEERGFQNSKGFNDKIIVPFAPESELSGIGYTDFINDFWYQKDITIPSDWAGKDIIVNFGGVYYEADIFVDGKKAATHHGGSSSFGVDITNMAKPGGTHSLVVHAKNDIRSRFQSAGKQNLKYSSYGCNYTRTTGIWQTVWIEPVDRHGLSDITVIPDIDQKQLIVRPEFRNHSDGSIEVILYDGDKIVSKATSGANNLSTLILPVKNMKLWSPESPFLYDIVINVKDNNGKIIDSLKSYAGMRKISIHGNRIFLNNQPYYQRLVLDQGFYPDGIWTAPSDEALKNDITLSKKAGFNGARLHQKVFEPRFHYWADKLGYITWGEAPSWGMDANSNETARNFIPEWAEIVKRDRNHPSIIIWTPMNEEWRPDCENYPRLVKNLYDITKMVDPTRPFHDASGGVHVLTDIWTVHTYEQDPARLTEQLFNNGNLMSPPTDRINFDRNGASNVGFNPPAARIHEFPSYDGKIPYLVDEFGGIKWNPADQQSGDDHQSWGYGTPPSSTDELLTRLESQVDALLSLSDNICGYCYTQLTDVEQEQNGIFFYNRVPKFDMERVHAIFSKTPY